MQSEEPKVDGRTLRYQHRRGELLDAALDYVYEKGLSNLSLRPLANALGVSPATLLHHFGSKESLASEISRCSQQRGFERLSARLARNLAPVELLRDEIEFQTETVENSMLFFFELYGLALQSPDRYAEFLDSVVTPWLSTIQAILLRDGCPPERAEALATLVLAATRGLLLDRLTTGDRERVDSAVDLLALLVETLKHPPTEGGR